jgi:peptidylprolyl isomerase
MGRARNGDKVRAHFLGKLENGETFLDTKADQPLEFTIGNGTILPHLENGVVNMEVGETKRISISPEEAYGPRREELLVEVNRSDLSEHITPSIGQTIELKQQDGNTLDVLIVDMNDETVTLDANHPLAGRTLVIDIELVEIM